MAYRTSTTPNCPPNPGLFYHTPPNHSDPPDPLTQPLSPPPPYPASPPNPDSLISIFSSYYSSLRHPFSHSYIEALFILGGILAGGISVGLQYALPPMDTFRDTHQHFISEPAAFIAIPTAFFAIHTLVKIIPGTAGSGIPGAMILLQNLER